ncbi:MAG TPA: hypothetical protein VMQ17_12445 [Candidatus Sulfotelmatobacter sp.]|jgi:hypothetical protein|nr:hypothetical protein [Candidatus Sulfotelmatobacter sp.]
MGGEPNRGPMMTQICWRLVDILSRMLDADERQAVRGDLAESGESIGMALRDVLGLIVRRQIGLWTDWQPWLALLAVASMAGVLLSRILFRFNVDLSQQLVAYQQYGVHFGTLLTPQQDMAFLLSLAVALLVWLWTCGFVLGSLSGGAIWLTWSVFYLMVLDSAWVRFVLSGNIIVRNAGPLRRFMAVTVPLNIATLLFLLAGLCGAFLGVRRRVLALRAAYVLASAITILTILTTWMSGWYETAHEVWSGGAWQGVSWPMRLLPLVLVSWPVAYVLATAKRRNTSDKEIT